MENSLNDQNQIKGEKRKVMLIIAGLIFLALLGIAFGAYEYQKGNISTIAGCLPGDKFSGVTGEPCFDPNLESCPEGQLFDQITGDLCIGAEDPKATPENGASDYNEVLETYVNKRILFDADCVPDPAALELLLGPQVLLANHSKTVIEVGLQDKKAILRPYHYMLSKPLLTTEEIPITCNGEVRATVIRK